MSRTNIKVLLASRPVKFPSRDNFKIVREPAPTLSPAETDMVLLETLYLSLDPAMRGWMNDVKSYIPPVQINAVMRGGTISRVLESNHSKFKPGDLVTSMSGWQTYDKAQAKTLQKIPTGLPVPPTAFLGVLGMTGMTAYFGLMDVGQPKAGETVLVSGAAGAVGSIVGQVAKLKGCRVVGTAGSDDKCAWLRSIGFDEAINYKTTPNLKRAVYKACPKGVDVYFDNVGGEMLEIALGRIRRKARVVICGAISQYNDPTGKKDGQQVVQGPSNYLSLLVNRARMEGFVVFDYTRQFPKAINELAAWIAQGKLEMKEHIVDNLEDAPDHLLKLFEGANTGKLIVRISKSVPLVSKL